MWFILVILALRRWRRENQEFKTYNEFSYVVVHGNTGQPETLYQLNKEGETEGGEGRGADRRRRNRQEERRRMRKKGWRKGGI